MAPGAQLRLPGTLALAAGLTVPLLSASRAEDASAPIALVERTAGSGLAIRVTYGDPQTSRYILETTGTGLAFLDYDRDDKLDLFVANGATLAGAAGTRPPRCALYRGHGDGTFVDVTDAAGVGRSGWGQGVAVGDYDNDGDPDLFLTFFGGSVLFRNDGNGTFSDATAQAGVAGGGWATSAAFADYDKDGDLDLYVARYVALDLANAPPPGTRRPGLNCSYRGFPVMCGPRGLAGERDVLYRNEGDGRFSDVTVAAGDLDRERYRGLGVVWGDYDNDSWPDLFVADDAHPNLLFHNQRDGSFSERAFQAGVAYDEDGRERAGMGTDFGDYDNDGWLDLVITNFYGEPNSLYRNLGDGSFLETTWPSGIGDRTLRYLGWGTAFADLDNDGWRDLFFVNGHVYPEVDRHGLDETHAQRSLLFRNLGDGRFADATPEAGLAGRRVGRGAAVGDYDRDGRLDLVIANLNDTLSLLHNETAAGGHWLSVRLVGRRSNRDGLGARLTAVAGRLTSTHEVHGGGSYLSHSDSLAHFGLGAAARVERLEVRWPSGVVDLLEDLPADRVLVVEEGKGLASR